ncbi:hypothetical protein [Rhodopseudomonas sp. B29]|uniref:hypothetical protein n=1 Tax=Rhodopseudomonas sp. B29 TaxID=95607 RepID=UPI00034490FE|nr:hypothetical protein [Rhodopseudomonas sp. B29]
MPGDRPAPPAPRLPNECKALGKPVPLPAPRKADLGVLAAENRAAAATANGRIVARDRCEDKQRDALESGGT